MVNLINHKPKPSGPGGKRPGAGRKKGAIDRVTREVAEREIKTGVTPLEVMLKTMRALWDEAHVKDEKGKVTLNTEKAKEAMVVADRAAPYCHARIAAVEPPQKPPEKAEEENELEVARRIAYLLHLAATGKRPAPTAPVQLPRPKAIA